MRASIPANNAMFFTEIGLLDGKVRVHEHKVRIEIAVLSFLVLQSDR
jgi:hypothetical protein